MTFKVLSSSPQVKMSAQILAVLRAAQPTALGVASAFVTLGGVEILADALGSRGRGRVHMVAGIDGAVTQPEALEEAVRLGWNVRLGSAAGPGIFHPKIIVGGDRFDVRGAVSAPACFYVGSGNLTSRGLNSNLECGVLGTEGRELAGLAQAFAQYWRGAKEATPKRLDAYAERFARENRTRRPEDLEILGVAEDEADRPVVPLRYARYAWAGLQSFTGEYTLQVEFPRDAGRVLKGIMAHAGSGATVRAQCVDNVRRSVLYKYYHDNSMFRLNVPNDVPGVTWARVHRKGILLVGLPSDKANYVDLAVVPPGSAMHSVIKRSQALKTLGRTQTRMYGWY